MRQKIAQIVLLFLGLALIPSVLWAKAAFFAKAEMIKRADIIALVTITSVDSTETKGDHWTYREVATANVDQVLKGNLSGSVKLFGGENFSCAQCHYEKGRFLVFLKRDKDLLRGANWYLSIRPISKNTIEWYKNNESLELEAKPLEEVLQEVQALVSGEPT